METIALVISIYLLFGIPLAAGGFLTWRLARKRIQLRTTDRLLPFLPFAIWFAAILLGAFLELGPSKSLSNTIEAFLAGCATAVFFAVRALITIARPRSEERWAAFALVASCLVAFALYALVPGLPE